MIPNNPNNDVKSTFSPHDTYDRMWLAKFNELCYEVFYKYPLGAQLLAHMENRYFRSPVAFPNKEPTWAYFNEGRNELIRSFTAGIQTHIAAQDVKSKAQTIPRRARVKPIPNEG
ncbi:TPA: hypothetical protein JAG59_002012 [Legionella pneumophila]|nr:hypothetical protein [Legionella pneumophila]HAT5964240.1 hypothetical protein [Legionella pneumophila]HAT5965754.1 hypothetical protein [Legionella pneumophila]HAT6392723.1 hypothetical protein [Legionella pneumophila]